MIEIKEKQNCSGCHACYSICPKNCIKMEKDEEGFAYPVVDKTNCINCGLCVRSCPILNKKKPEEKILKTYAAINTNEEVRLKSASGGLFSAFADYVLEQGGVVFGAGFDEKFVVHHQACETKEDLKKLRMSKYVQSKIGETFKQAKEYLDQNRLVYFSGTHCQISGLKNFLRKDYPNLITQDLICHGVPSPLIWEKYVEYKSKNYKLKPANIFFRDKSLGWFLFSIKIDYGKDHKPYRRLCVNDSYMNMFIHGRILRPSCYTCHFKGEDRISDITLADFWGGGFKKYAPSMNDKKGCSLVVAHTHKAEKILEILEQQNKIKKVLVPTKLALKGNPMFYKSSKKSVYRKTIMRKINNVNFKRLAKRYGWIIA